MNESVRNTIRDVVMTIADLIEAEQEHSPATPPTNNSGQAYTVISYNHITHQVFVYPLRDDGESGYPNTYSPYEIALIQGDTPEDVVSHLYTIFRVKN